MSDEALSVGRCIDKVFMEERTEWEVVVKCEHSYNRRCAKTLKTRYEAAQVGKDKDKYIIVDAQRIDVCGVNL